MFIEVWCEIQDEVKGLPITTNYKNYVLYHHSRLFFNRFEQ